MLGLGLRQTKAYKLNNIMGGKFLFRLIQTDFGLLKKIRAGNSSRSRQYSFQSWASTLSFRSPHLYEISRHCNTAHNAGAVPGFEKGVWFGRSNQYLFGQFIGDFLKNLAQKGGGVRPPLWICACNGHSMKTIYNINLTLVQISRTVGV